jgi:asparagine synthase (glutamine-hydrolysing)
MCGIAGFWSNSEFKPDGKIVLRKMTEKLYHRGPDGYGFHYNPDDRLAMGHARLSIIDLETGSQPLYATQNKNVLTVNGEFYDYKRIRTQLRLDGAQFTSKSDSEIALPLFDRYGLDFVQHLRGEFAIALYDQARDRMILVRDRFGVKPLFYHVGQNSVVYGSEIKALFEHPEVPRAFSNEAVVHQLMHTMVPGSTAYKDIQALEPGHMLVINRKNKTFQVQDIRYWDMDFPEEQDRKEYSAAYHIQRVQDTLSEAVRFRLEADVPVGCYLSGGIDSCAMLGLSSSMQQSPVKAFTISFDHDAYDEAAIAREMAQRVQADQEQINLSASELYGENYIKTLYFAERTFYNTLGVAKYCMSKRVNESGYRVVVTGEGSDELFGGYAQFKRDMFLHGYTKAERKSFLSHMDKSNQVFKGAILSENLVSHPAFENLMGFTPSWIQPWMQTLDVAYPLLRQDIRNDLKDYDPIEAIVGKIDRSQLEGRHFLDQVQYTWSKTMLEGQILNWGGDRVDMANSMESRPAFLDHHVAEAAVQIPPKYRIKGNTEKWVLREAMKNILPEVLYKREKFAFMAPPGHTEKKKQNALHDLFDTYLNPSKIEEVGLFDPNQIETFISAYKQDTDATSLVRKDAIINHVLGLQILHDHFLK